MVLIYEGGVITPSIKLLSHVFMGLHHSLFLMPNDINQVIFIQVINQIQCPVSPFR